MARKPNKKLDKLRRRNLGYMAACAAAVMVIAVLLMIPGKEDQTVRGEFTPPPFEPAAVAGTPEVPAELGWSELAVREGFTASVCGVLNEQDGQVTVWLYNHSGNDCWLKLRLTDTKGNILGETGLLKPGEHVRDLTLTDVPRSDTTVVLKLMGYEPETYYSGGSVGLETLLKVSG